MAFSPTPFMPLNPNRISPASFTAKPLLDSFISGPSTFKPMRLHSSILNVIFSILPAWFNTAAMYSAG